MKTVKAAINIIKESEGCRLKAYQCPAKVWSIGFGHTRGVLEHDIISIEQANQFLYDDIREIEQQVDNLSLNLNDNQYGALVSLVYNIGISNFKDSTLLRLVIDNPNQIAIDSQFKRWIYVNSKPVKGLRVRRARESHLYFSKEK